MADINELYDLLRNADAAAQAGDEQAAVDVKALLGEIDRIQAETKQTQPVAEPSAAKEALDYAAPVIRGVLPTVATLGAGALAAATVGAPAAAGAGALALGSALADPLVAGVNKLFGTRLTSPTEAWSQLMDQIGVPVSSTEGARLIEAISAGGMSALTGAGAGKLLMQLNSPLAKSIGSALSSGIGQQVVAGMGAGAGSELARSGAEAAGLGETGQTVAGLAGGLAGGMLGAKVGAPRSLAPTEPKVPGMTPQEVRDTVAAAQAEGKSVMTSDVFPPETKWQKLRQEFGEGTLLGTATQRALEQQDRVNSVSELLAHFGASADSEVINDVMKSLDQTRSANLAALSGQKNAIVNRVSSAMPAMQASELQSTLATIDAEARRLAGINKSHFAPAISKLSEVKAALLGDPIIDPATNAIIGYTGKPLSQIEPNLRVLGSSMASDPSLAHIKTDFQKVAGKVRSALRSDVKDFIEAAEGPAAASEWSIANRKISGMIDEVQSTALRSVLRRGKGTPEIVGNLLYSAKPSEVKVLVNNLDAAGLDYAKSAFWSKMAKDSLASSGEISIPRFLTNAQKKAASFGILFSPDELKIIDGKLNYLKLTQRSGSFNDNPQTGAKLAMPLFVQMIANASGGIAKAAGAIGGFGLATRAYESPATRNLLMKLPSLAPNSPEQLAMAKRISTSLQSDYANQIADQVRNKQLTFLPESTQQEKMGQGMALTDATTGYRMLTKDNKKFGLYGPDNQRIGIFSSQEDARKRAEKEFRKRK
jgi:hypothetical protein